MTDAPQEPKPAPSYYSSATPPPPVTPGAVPPAGEPPQPDVPSAESPKPESPKRSATVGIIAALAVGALVGGVSGAGVGIWAVSANSSNVSGTNATPTSITVNDAEDATIITGVAAQASPSVVTISVTGGSSAGTGSGVVLSEDGYIVTNTHVVTLDGETAGADISVETSDGRLLSAELIGTDPIFDLAVIKVNDVDNMQPAEFADSSKLNVGDTAIAIGAPLGLSGTVTNGIVSALNRSITVASAAAPESEDDSTTPPEDPTDPWDLFNFDVPGQDNTQSIGSATISLAVIQTDAAINPGNSGGGLFDSDGNIIGINVAIASAGGGSATAGSIGVGFAIPSNVAERVTKELIENGTASHGLLGAGVLDVSSASAPDATTVGALIDRVTSGGAAEGGGLRSGDIITQFNGIPITDSTDLTAQVRTLAAGAEAEVTYVRDGNAETTTVTLGELPQ